MLIETIFETVRRFSIDVSWQSIPVINNPLAEAVMSNLTATSQFD